MAPKVYRIGPSEDREYYVNGSHRWNLPGVRCPACKQTWANIGLQYPTVDLSHFPAEQHYRKARAVDLAEYEQLGDELLDWVPQQLLVQPGTEFGPLRGEAGRGVADLEWVHPWNVLVRPDLLKQLETHGVRNLRGQRAELTGLGSDYLVDLEVPPCAVMHPSTIPSDVPPPCAACGRWGIRVPYDLTLAEHSLPESVDLFRGVDCTTVIFATERLIEALHIVRATNFVSQEVPVAE